MHHEGMLRQMDFGPPQQVRLCVELDDGVTEADARQLIGSWNSEAPRYGLYVTPVSFEHHSRNGFFHWQIMHDIEQIPLKAPCDRLMFFANRNFGDFLYGIAGLATGVPEVLGEVDDTTLTHGFVYAKIATPNQLLIPPSAATRHEMYHLLGCGQHFNMPACYVELQYLKSASKVMSETADESRPEDHFFPTYANRTASLVLTRDDANAMAGRHTGTAAMAAQ